MLWVRLRCRYQKGMGRTTPSLRGPCALGVLANRKDMYKDDFFREIRAIKPPGKKTESNGSKYVAWSSWNWGWREEWQQVSQQTSPSSSGQPADGQVWGALKKLWKHPGRSKNLPLIPPRSRENEANTQQCQLTRNFPATCFCPPSLGWWLEA